MYIILHCIVYIYIYIYTDKANSSWIGGLGGGGGDSIGFTWLRTSSCVWVYVYVCMYVCMYVSMYVCIYVPL